MSLVAWAKAESDSAVQEMSAVWSSLPDRLAGLVGKAFAPRAAVLSSIPALAVDLCPAQVIPVT